MPWHAASIGRPHALGLRAAFTLFELVSVLAILGVLSASAIPAISAITSLGVVAVREEVSTCLVFARETAAATGTPTGVRFDIDSQEMSLVELGAGAGMPTDVLDSSGQARDPVRIDRLGGASVAGVTGTGASGGVPVIWFGHAGVPELRGADGAYLQDAPADISVTFTAGTPIVVHPHTGVLE